MIDRKRQLPRTGEYHSLDGKVIQSQEAFDDVAEAVLKLRQALKRHGFDAPAAIELASHQDGHRLRHILPRDLIAAYQAPNRDPNKDDVIFTIMGIEFRYPAAYRSKGRGFDVK